MVDSTSLITVFGVGGIAAGLAATIGRASAQAISRLVTGASEIPEAWLASKAQAVRDRTAAASAYRAALNEEAVKLALADPDRVERAMLRLVAVEDRKQQNREAVASLAVEELTDKPPSGDEPVSEEFLDRFESLASSASSEELRSLYARILAGECRKPGSFSMASLHIFSIMDRQMAATIDQFSGLISGVPTAYSIPAGGTFAIGRKMLALKSLEAHGLISHGLTTHAKPGKTDHHFFFQNVALRVEKIVDKKVSFDVAFLTPLGEQVFSLVRKPLDHQDEQNVIDYLKSVHGVISVFKRPVSGSEGSLVYAGPELQV